MEDPAAGQWFVEQARELIALAEPAARAARLPRRGRTHEGGEDASSCDGAPVGRRRATGGRSRSPYRTARR